VISHNEIQEISGIEKLKGLTKLSASHNQIQALSPILSGLSALKEIRLAHNQIKEIPEFMKSLQRYVRMLAEFL
jgi:Leucine-rich repeat (LRR) protein